MSCWGVFPRKIDFGATLISPSILPADFLDLEYPFAGVLDHEIMGNLFTLEGFLEIKGGFVNLQAGNFRACCMGLDQATEDCRQGE